MGALPRLMIVTLLSATITGAYADGLWSGSVDLGDNPSATPHPQAESPQISSAGVELGEWVTFRGVGTVFYAGRSGGEVYFAAQDEYGTFSWDEAVSVCQRKGTGWMLPTTEHLNMLYANAEYLMLPSKGMRVSSGSWYWTSTPVMSDSAWMHRLSDSDRKEVKTRFSARVRCARLY